MQIKGKESAEKGWDEVTIPTTATKSKEEVDPNDDLYSEEVEKEIAAKVAPKKAIKKAKEIVEELPEDDEEEDDNDTSFEESVEDESEDESEVEEELEELSQDEPESEEVETADTEETETSTQNTKKSRIPKRVEKLMGKLQQADEEREIRELEFATREAELLEVIRQQHERLNTSLSTVADTKLNEAKSAVEMARRKLKAAKANADDEQELEAIEELADAKAMLRNVESMAAEATQRNNDESTKRGPINTRQVIAQRKNGLFVKSNEKALQNPVVVNTVTKIDTQLQQEGYDPADDDYREELAKRTNKALSTRGLSLQLVNPFAKKTFTEDLDEGDEEVAEPVKKESATPPTTVKKKPLNPMSRGAPVAKKTRTVARLDESDRLLSQKFGIKEDILLKQRAISNRHTGEGYSSIYVPTKK